MKKSALFLCFFVSLSLAASFAGDLSLDDLIGKMQANQKKIHDMYAETTTIITSNLAMPASPAGSLGVSGKGSQ